MQKSPRISVDAAFEKRTLDKAYQRKDDPTPSPLQQEIERLKQENTDLKRKLEEKDTKLSNVRIQLQILWYLINLKKLVENKTLKQIETFFSSLLNRNPQRARRHFSHINELTTSRNKAEAKNILRDLQDVLKLFVDFGEKGYAKKVQNDIERLRELQSRKTL